eukprot:359286-Chlamydomonas_euryale.AAC.1
MDGRTDGWVGLRKRGGWLVGCVVCRVGALCVSTPQQQQQNIAAYLGLSFCSSSGSLPPHRRPTRYPATLTDAPEVASPLWATPDHTKSHLVTPAGLVEHAHLGSQRHRCVVQPGFAGAVHCNAHRVQVRCG